MMDSNIAQQFPNCTQIVPSGTLTVLQLSLNGSFSSDPTGFWYKVVYFLKLHHGSCVGYCNSRMILHAQSR